MLRSTITLRWSCLIACLAVGPFQANASKERFEPQPTPLLRAEENRKVIIFDNDFLDRRFGRSRGSETSVSTAPVERGVFVYSGPQIVEILPRRSTEALPNGSLLTGINRSTPAHRAAALRLAETGRTLLQQGQTRKAIYYLEKALGMVANPAFHF